MARITGALSEWDELLAEANPNWGDRHAASRRLDSTTLVLDVCFRAAS